ncbi:MAG: hypothetical protein AB7W16_15615 [Candidatus Obscuribacterales bacterium]
MNIHTLIREWDDLLPSRKKKAYKELMEFLRLRDDEDEMYEVFSALLFLEEQDFFGTEGADL